MHKHSKPKKREYLAGIIKFASKRGGTFVSEKTDAQLEIPFEFLGTALEGDMVKVERFYNNQLKKEAGKVLEIIKREKTEFSGTVIKDDKNYYVSPTNRKIYTEIYIPEDESSKISEGDKVIVKITKWKNQQMLPYGKIVKILGKSGEHEAEMHAIISDYGFEMQYPDVGHIETNINKIITTQEIAKRKDFRKTITFTIDPADAKDFDDAISFCIKENGNYEIGVHIADVSHFVRPGSSLDKEAQKRATSVYLVDRTVPMLPEILSNNLCSLVPNEDRLTFSTVFDIDKEARVVKKWFGKTVINSDKRFTYEEVQDILENKQGEPFAKELKIINELAKKVRQKRFEHGAMSLDTEEIKFVLDEKGKPIDVYKKEQNDAHKLIEEFMLLANKNVAEFIFKKGTEENVFVYRNHDLPNAEKIAGLNLILEALGHKLKFKDGQVNSNKINEAIENLESPEEKRLVKSMVLRSMAKAVYSTENIGHFGLAFDFYTHFTSPIRRYPDVMVHRLLEHYLNNKASPEQERVKYKKLCEHSSRMERLAMEAERDSIKYKQVEYCLDKIGNIYGGIITGISNWGIYVEAKEIMCEGMVGLRSMKDDFYELDKAGISITGQKTKKRYRLGDEVKIKIVSANLQRRNLDFELV